MNIAERDMSATTATATSRLQLWMGYPRGTWLIISVEFWERFSYYGMLAILALFLTADTTGGGFGWPRAKALGLVGIYSAAMFTLPAVGGWLVDRFVGRRRGVAVGASLMLMGHVLMASPYFIPVLLGMLHDAPLLAELHALGVPLGYVVLPAEVEAALASRGALLHPEHGAAWLQQSYLGMSLGFYAAIACLMAGNALMKSTLVVLCGDTLEGTPARQEGAYTYYYLAINVGAMLSGVVVGLIAQSVGWHFGFSTAAVGMATALGVYLYFGPRWLGSIGTTIQRGSSGKTAPGEETTSGGAAAGASGNFTLSRLLLIFVLAMLLCVYSTGSLQLFGSWLLFIEHNVDRSLGGFAVPVPWFTSWNSLVIISTAPLLAAFWVSLGNRGRSIDMVWRYVFALATAAIAHFLLYWAAAIAANGAPATALLPLCAIGLVAFGEMVAWTSAYGMVYRAAPRGYVAATMGGWYLLTLGLGGYLSGVVGGWVDTLDYGPAFLLIGVLITLVALIGIAIRPALLRLARRIGVSL
jgi:POT family proton-dependent oligopeptide transporter